MMQFDRWVDAVYLRQLQRDGQLPSPLYSLVTCMQDPEYHPEGSVWEHTLLALEVARNKDFDIRIKFAVLCHDLGKPIVSTVVDEKIKTYGHEEAGLEPTRYMLSLVGIVDANSRMFIETMVLNHMIPYHLLRADAPLSAYRRFENKLNRGRVSLDDMHDLFLADQFGRRTPDAIKGESPKVHLFASKIEEYREWWSKKHQDEDPPSVVTGKHLLDMGMEQGPHIGQLLKDCRRIQLTLGWVDP